MKVQHVYTDTSVIGGCFDDEFAQWSDALVRDFRLERLRLVLSDVVALELAARYQVHGILTPKYATDGLHIALATVSGVDVLVSWNFRHIVRFDKIRLFNAVNLETGYKPISIHSPCEVATNPEDESDEES